MHFEWDDCLTLVSPFLRLSTHNWRHRLFDSPVQVIRFRCLLSLSQNAINKTFFENRNVIKNGLKKHFHNFSFLSSFRHLRWCLEACEHAYFSCANEMKYTLFVNGWCSLFYFILFCVERKKNWYFLFGWIWALSALLYDRVDVATLPTPKSQPLQQCMNVFVCVCGFFPSVIK